MTKYTKGKWELEEQDKRFLIYCEPHEQDISCLPKTDKTSEYNHDIDNGAVEANANLIASAPDMFEALELMLQLEINSQLDFNATEEEIDSMEHIIKARKAIAKAKGLK